MVRVCGYHEGLCAVHTSWSHLHTIDFDSLGLSYIDWPTTIREHDRKDDKLNYSECKWYLVIQPMSLSYSNLRSRSSLAESINLHILWVDYGTAGRITYLAKLVRRL